MTLPRDYDYWRTTPPDWYWGVPEQNQKPINDFKMSPERKHAIDYALTQIEPAYKRIKNV